MWKLTGYRKMAEKIIDIVVEQLNKEFDTQFGSSITKRLPISGGDISGSKFFGDFVEKRTELGQHYGLTAEESKYVARFYGTNVDKIFDYVSKANGSLPPIVYGQLYYAMNEEAASTPLDFFVRRTGALYFKFDFVQQYKELVIDEMEQYLNWTTEQKMKYTEQLEMVIRQVTT